MLQGESWCLSFLRLKAAVKGLIHLLFASKLILSSYLQISFKFDWIWSFIRKSLWSYSVQSKLMGESVSQGTGISKHISLSPFHFLSIRVIMYVRELCPSSVHFALAPHNFPYAVSRGVNMSISKLLTQTWKRAVGRNRFWLIKRWIALSTR